MSARRAWWLPVLLGLAACAGRAPRAPAPVEYRQDVARQVLPPQSGGGAAAVPSYSLRQGERFRMPEPLSAPEPALPASAAMRELAPTRVCARVAIAADGAVMFADNLTARAECVAGAEPANAALVEAMLAALRGWRFRPAAMCRFQAGAPMPDGDGCDGAQQVEPVPVTLQFAFTFAVHAGRVQVRRDGVPR